MVERECVDQRSHERPRVLVRRRLVRELDEPRELDEGALRRAHFQQRTKAGLVEAGIDRGAPAMIDQQAHAGIGEERQHRHELVVLDLDI